MTVVLLVSVAVFATTAFMWRHKADRWRDEAALAQADVDDLLAANQRHMRAWCEALDVRDRAVLARIEAQRAQLAAETQRDELRRRLAEATVRAS